MLKKILASLLSISLVFMFTQKSYASLLDKLSSTIRQLFLDEAKEIADSKVEEGEKTSSIKEEAEWLVSAEDVVIRGRKDGENLTRLTTEDIDSLGSLHCMHIEFEYCDFTGACLEGMFKNVSLIDIGFGCCKPTDEELDKLLAREGWGWWDPFTFHDLRVGTIYYR